MVPNGVSWLNPKSSKNYQITKSTNQEENFSKKIMLRPLKETKNQKIVLELPDRINRLNPKSLKLSEHQIYQSEQKCSQKKYV
jgi:hypothetical protein